MATKEPNVDTVVHVSERPDSYKILRYANGNMGYEVKVYFNRTDEADCKKASEALRNMKMSVEAEIAENGNRD